MPTLETLGSLARRVLSSSQHTPSPELARAATTHRTSASRPQCDQGENKDEVRRQPSMEWTGVLERRAQYNL